MVQAQRVGDQPMAADADQQSDADAAVLSIRDLRQVYNLGSAEEREAIANISFSVQPGEFVCIVGPSGAGKTTLLRCLSGLLKPTGGEVRFEGHRLDKVPDRLSVVFQDYSRSLFPWLTVAGNIAVPLKVAGLGETQRKARIEEVLHAVGLGAVGKQYPWQLSGGMQQRVAIARSLAHQPELLLMDEPFASVDAQTRFDLEDLILRVRGEYNVTVVLVTHDIDEAALSRRPGGRALKLAQPAAHHPGRSAGATAKPAGHPFGRTVRQAARPALEARHRSSGR